MSAKKENPSNYIGRTEEGIRRLIEREKAKVGNLVHLNRRKELHRINPCVRAFSQAKERAKKKDISFGFARSKDLPSVPEICPALLIPLFVGDEKSTDNSPTLDRIDNNKGYIKGNVQWISRKANQMKSNANFKEIKMLYNYMKKQYLERRRCDK